MVEYPLFEIVLKRLTRLAAMPRNSRRSRLFAVLEAAYPWQVTADTAAKVREQDLEGRKFVEQPAIDQSHRGHH